MHSNNINKNSVLYFPIDSSGNFGAFKLKETQVMHPLLAKKFNSLKTYKGYCEETNQHISFTFSKENGVSGLISGKNKTINIEPLGNSNHSFTEIYKESKPQSSFECISSGEIKKTT